MESFVREHSFGSIFKSTFAVFLRGFWTFFFTYTLPVLPFFVLQMEFQARSREQLPLLAIMFASSLVGFFAYGASVISVSDICLGNKPSLFRSYSRVFSKLAWRMFITSILTMVVVFAGIVLLIIPGLIFGVWFLYAQIVVMLEGLSGPAALKRSKALGKGFYWRTVGIYGAFALLMGLIVGVIAFATAFVVPSAVVLRVMIAILETGVVVPLSFIMFVLLYYDLRARKEAYDNKVLAEELRR